MSLIKSFRALRPARGRAAEVLAPPYDVLSEEEARRQVQDRPWSFLHISRAEVDLPQGTDPYAPGVYAKAAQNLAGMGEEGVLVRDPAPCYSIYRLIMGEHTQTGLVAAASVAAYDAGRIKRHEFTRPAKEDDRVRQIEALNAQTGPVFLVYPGSNTADQALERLTTGAPDVDVTAGDGVRHQLWVVSESGARDELTRIFETMPALYVADGHHRSAAASRVRALRRAANQNPVGDESYNYFLAVIFPHSQMQILDYNRVIRDLNGLDREGFLQRVEERFRIEPCDQPVRPRQSAEFGMYLEGQWYRLALDPARIPVDDPVGRLDASLLADNLIEPVLGISDPRRDGRIDFVGGIRGLEGLEQRVDSGEMQVAFALCPTTMDDLMAVADAGKIMPPKSTWFEPKLADGLVSHVLD